MAISLPIRVPDNAPGDFYVQAGLCTQCCLVHGEAPTLLNDPKEPFAECYFRRQPVTPQEIDQAIDAVCVSEMCALRYGGSDPAILKKFHQRDAAWACDQTAQGRAWLETLSIANAPPVRTPSWWRRLLDRSPGGRRVRRGPPGETQR